MTSFASAPQIERFDTVDSTLTVLASMVQDNPALPSYTTVIAEHQSQGRGRLGREWVDKAQHALLLATLIRIDDAHLSWATPLAGIAMARALEHMGTPVALKWPNDILLGSRKVAGILCEHLTSDEVRGSARHVIAIGIGVNLGVTPDNAGPIAGAVPVPDCDDMTLFRERLLMAFLLELRMLLAAPDETAWHIEYENFLTGIGQETTIHLPDGTTLALTLTGVDRDGALKGVDSQGILHTVTAGDVGLPSVGTSAVVTSTIAPATPAASVAASASTSTPTPHDHEGRQL